MVSLLAHKPGRKSAGAALRHLGAIVMLGLIAASLLGRLAESFGGM